ncbi:MAG TPA: acetyl-CoA carboxylase, carboxyltransferase subunit beta [Chlamydiales bacterium]|jgi:acetyl-CoA carboxylase carboxyl transferase subunit beta
MGFFSRKPKIKVQTTKKDGFSGWIKCSGCAELVHGSQLEQKLNCCPKCDYHYRLSLTQRIALLSDEGTFQELFTHIKPVDSLNFVDTESYKDRLSTAQKKTHRDDALSVGICQLNQISIALAVLDFSFMGGSMGSVMGERLTLLIELALEKSLPLIIVSASGGARMQESILSLMQMAKTSAALAKLHEKRIPYISVLTNPTTGGVTASFATLGDLIVAEPDALIAFAGPRVVEQTIGQKLPPRAQKSEFLLERGMVDLIVKRSELKTKLAQLIGFLIGNERPIEEEPLAQKMSLPLKRLLKQAEKMHAKESATTASSRR